MTGRREPTGGDAVPDRLLAPALEFAVGVAAVWARLRPSVSFPAALRPLFRGATRALGPSALATARAAVENDPSFRARLAAVADPALVGEIGVLWLVRPDGWEERAARLAAQEQATSEAEAAAVHAAVRAAERRREAAERAQRTALAEVAALRAEVDELRREIARAHDTVRRLDRMEVALESARAEAAGLRDRLAEATRRVDEADTARRAADERAGEAERLRDEALEARVRAWQEQVEQQTASQVGLDGGDVRPLRPRPDRRTPIAIPGGLYGTSVEAARHLLTRTGVVVVVDGYNVAKAAWPALSLEQQRERCVAAAEDVARRHGPQIAVIFDGADVDGGHAPVHRVVRTAYSPAGVTADDVIRAEVARLPVEVPVVVVTDDRAIVDDVRRRGANVIATGQWLEVAGHR